MADCDMNSMLSAYYDGELSPQEQQRVQMHLHYCHECAAELERMRVLSAALSALAIPEPSVDFVGRLQEQGARVEQTVLVRFARRLTAVAAAVLMLAMARFNVVNFMNGDSSQSTGRQTSIGLSAWERAAIDPQPGAPAAANPVVASIDLDTQFDEFMAHDLTGGDQ
jgi:anti-sigma factor RsiW